MIGRKKGSVNSSSPIPQTERFLDASQPKAHRDVLDGMSSLTLIVGALLVVSGLVFLLQNLETFPFTLQNTWAFFLFFPAAGAFETARRMYRNRGRCLTPATLGALLAGGTIALLALALLLGLDWNFLGPVLVLLAGMGLLVDFMLPGRL